MKCPFDNTNLEEDIIKLRIIKIIITYDFYFKSNPRFPNLSNLLELILHQLSKNKRQQK